MLKSKHTIIASAVVLACGAGPVFGQYVAPGSTSVPSQLDVKARDNPDERASAVIRLIDGDNPSSSATPVNMTELARARAAGEMQAAERGEPIQIERIRIEEPVRSGSSAPAARGAAGARVPSANTNGRPQIVYADRASGDPVNARGVVRLDDAARYRETARYEADRKRRESAKAVAASEQGRARAAEPAVTVMGTAQGRAEIAWSAPERAESRVAALEVPTELLFE